MTRCPDRNEDGHAKAHRLPVDEADAPHQHALGLEPLDPFPARRGRQPYPLRDLGNRDGRVLLQDSEYPAIDTIENNFLYE
ncbi:hypothetical protein GCM10010990_33660 [Croceicoccus mobilis]|uniref:Uncharacterized protein n=1 Tax=Croceicoccus mobilis TaxID=1703339 RepID=A0A916Z880_9SPHN|nr:hypothetical protein GCM10010990_33660 [Croceicoccus mobilis]